MGGNGGANEWKCLRGWVEMMAQMGGNDGTDGWK